MVERLQGYELEVTPKGITIQALTPTGLFYGLQTVRQLEKDGQIACVCVRFGNIMPGGDGGDAGEVVDLERQAELVGRVSQLHLAAGARTPGRRSPPAAGGHPRRW